MCFFFFQAEDGIRDIGVTGVQTCALPIYNTILYKTIGYKIVLFLKHFKIKINIFHLNKNNKKKILLKSYSKTLTTDISPNLKK